MTSDKSRTRSTHDPGSRAASTCQRACGLVALLLFLLCACIEAPPAARREPSRPLFAHPGECRDCHDELVNGVPLEAPPAAVCSSSGCHGDLRTGPGHVHGPTARGECTICHVPHSSHREDLVAAAPNPLCRSCHEPLVTCPVRAAPEDAACTRCHLPHVGADHLLLRDRVSEFEPGTD